mmetsp:Transcript_16268/g.56823  ORF Transcript_16268/g.56823 Transcript_16268/m.56823 type:complete len:451 (+) Transcript_16268:144-1496(+)
MSRPSVAPKLHVRAGPAVTVTVTAACAGAPSEGALPLTRISKLLAALVPQVLVVRIHVVLAAALAAQHHLARRRVLALARLLREPRPDGLARRALVALCRVRVRAASARPRVWRRSARPRHEAGAVETAREAVERVRRLGAPERAAAAASRRRAGVRRHAAVRRQVFANARRARGGAAVARKRARRQLRLAVGATHERRRLVRRAAAAALAMVPPVRVQARRAHARSHGAHAAGCRICTGSHAKSAHHARVFLRHVRAAAVRRHAVKALAHVAKLEAALAALARAAVVHGAGTANGAQALADVARLGKRGVEAAGDQGRLQAAAAHEQPHPLGIAVDGDSGDRAGQQVDLRQHARAGPQRVAQSMLEHLQRHVVGDAANVGAPTRRRRVHPLVRPTSVGWQRCLGRPAFERAARRSATVVGQLRPRLLAVGGEVGLRLARAQDRVHSRPR